MSLLLRPQVQAFAPMGFFFIAALCGCLTKTHVTEEISAIPALTRSEHHLSSEAGISIFVTRVATSQPHGAVVLTHGAGSPASAVWDLPNGYSLMETLASAGYDTYTVDVRGFGGSTQPAEMRDPNTDARPAVRAAEVMKDLETVVAFARAQSKVKQVDLVGWSWGCVVAGMYAGYAPQNVRRLVLYAPVYDRKWPTRHKTRGAARTESRDLHMKWLDPTTEDPTIRAAFVQKLFRFTDSDELLLPNGPYRDVYGPDSPVWEPQEVQAPTLIIRGELDRASLREPALRLYDSLVKAKARRYLELSGTGHFAFRTYQNQALQSVVRAFIVDPIPSKFEPGPTSASNVTIADEEN